MNAKPKPRSPLKIDLNRMAPPGKRPPDVSGTMGGEFTLQWLCSRSYFLKQRLDLEDCGPFVQVGLVELSGLDFVNRDAVTHLLFTAAGHIRPSQFHQESILGA